MTNEAIPDSADLDPLGGVDAPGTAEPNEVIPDSVDDVERKEYVGRTMSDDLAELGNIAVDGSAKLNLLCPHCKRTGEGQIGFDGPEWDKEAHISGVLPIAPGSKYVILIPDDTETELIFQLQDLLGDWWGSDDQPFMIISDKFEFVKVDEGVNVPALASCGYHKCPGHKPGSGEVCPEIDLEAIE